MSQDALNSAEIARLKQALFGEERRLLGEIRARVAEHEARIGSEENLRRSVSEVIASALQDARAERHEELAAAVAPLVIGNVRREIFNARDELLDALYPDLGGMVSAYVRTALRDMFYGVDRRLESTFSLRRWGLRLRSALTGVPVNHLLLRRQKVLVIAEAMLVERDTGRLIAKWQAEPPERTRGADRKGPAAAYPEPAGPSPQEEDKLAAALLSAINAFAVEALAKKRGALRAIDVAHGRFHVRATPKHILAVKCAGEVSRAGERVIDAAIEEILAKYNAILSSGKRAGTQARLRRIPLDLAALLAQRLMPEMTDAAMRRARPVYAIAAASLLLLTGLGSAGRYVLKEAQAAQAQSRIEGVIEQRADFSGFPVLVVRDPDTDGFVITGAAPSPEAAASLAQSILETTEGLVPVTVNLATGLVTTTTELVGGTLNTVTQVVDGTLREVTSIAGGLTNKTGKLVDGLGKDVAKAGEDLAGAASDAVTRTLGAVESLSGRVAGLERSLAAADADGVAVRLPPQVADLPVRVAEVERRVAARLNEIIVADLSGRVAALTTQLRDATAGAGDATQAVAQGLNREVAALTAEIRTVAARLAAKPGAGPAELPLSEISNLFAKVAETERRAAALPLRREVEALETSVRDLHKRVKADEEERRHRRRKDGAAEEADDAVALGPRRRERKEAKVENADYGWTDALNETLKPPPIPDLPPFSAEASVREAAARVRGKAAGPKINIRSGGDPRAPGDQAASPPADATASAAGGVVNGVTGATQNVVGGVTGATQNVVGGVVGATQNVVKGLTGGKK